MVLRSSGLHISQVGGGDQRGKMSCMPASTKPLACFLRTHDEVMVERCNRPTVARFAHFKLLRSSSVGSTRPGNEPRNMEVVNLHTFGIPLPRLADLLRLDGEPQLKETSWKRLHPVREEYDDWSPTDWTTLASLPTPPIEDDWADWFRTNNPAYSDNYDGPYPLPLSYPLPHVYFFA
ncbi:expressed unknown protein [Seminavis robusta]|uniref:Uncharacterized protein n=1 Tax=Seminavis robusta TaxID=568900 RepID=A0A9N8F5L3_9STRA|nr:expressed unknown protein [Seminavis robusta]|eukprot:Sro3488_g348540.1 n/a (178) ;mRNA; r:4460-4993